MFRLGKPTCIFHQGSELVFVCDYIREQTVTRVGGIMDRNGFMQVLMALVFVSAAEGISLSGSSSHGLLGQSFRFTCTVTGSSSEFLVFQRDARDVCTILPKTCKQLATPPGYISSCGQSGVYHMDITSVSKRDEGRWNCKRSQNSNNITLPVYYGPNNVTVGNASTVAVTEDVNASLTVRCSADCNPACNYTWSKGTQQVSDNRNLPISSFRRGQEGNYTCTAINSFSRAERHLTVDVQWHPEKPTHNCPHWIVLGQTVRCRCQTSDRGNPSGTVQWISPGGQMISSSVSSSVQLNLTSIRRSVSGRNYICRANNSLPSSNSDTTYVASIAYLDWPNITLNKQDVMENDSVTVTCTVESNPPATMTIEYGNMELLTRTTNNITHTIERVRCPHNGTFSCTTKNSQTRKDTSNIAQLNVLCSPRQVSGRPTSMVVPGERMNYASLTADVIANPLPNFTWFKHSSPQMPVDNGTGSFIVSSGLSSTLKVLIKSEEDYTKYSVVVENSLGKITLFFSVTKAVVSNSTVPKVDIIPVVAGVGAAALVILIIVIIVILHRRGVLKCKGNSNKNDCPTQQGDGARAIDNVYLEGDNGLKYGRDEDGLMYVGVEFGNQATPTAAPEWTDEATEYAGIAHGIVGCPLPPEKGDEKKEK